MIEAINNYKINLRYHWWIDAGLVGLFNIAEPIAKNFNVDIKIESDGLSFQYSNKENLHSLLEECYSKLVDTYWNVSSRKQIENPDLIKYDKIKDEFSLIPKRDPTPIPKLFVKGSSWRADYLEFDKLDSGLHEKTWDFLNRSEKKLWGDKKNRLLFSSPVCHADLKIFPEEKTNKSVCSICGKETSNCSEVSQPNYLLFASTNAAKSFNSQIKNPDKICWECEFLSKFAVETASYKKIFNSKDYNLFIMQVVSTNMKKLIDLQNKLGSKSILRRLDEDYFYSNIGIDKTSLLHYSRLPYEFLWAFYNDFFLLMKEESEKNHQTNECFLNDLFEISLDTSPTQIFLLSISGKGLTFIINDLISYNDTTYIFRLLFALNEIRIDFSEFFYDLYDKDNKGNESHWRNKFFHRILTKKSVLRELETFTFHKSKGGNHSINVNQILNFVKNYEPLVKEESMKQDQVDVAVNLGKQIVDGAKLKIVDKDQGKNNDLKKIKGNLFTLRKTRTVADFLNQINTFQLRYDILISNSILEGILEECCFEDFRAYCMLGALNKFNYYMKNIQEKNQEENTNDK